MDGRLDAHVFAPLMILLRAVTAAPAWEMGTYNMARRLIELHALMALLIMLGGCALVQHYPLLGVAGFCCIRGLVIDVLILFWSPWLASTPKTCTPTALSN